MKVQIEREMVEGSYVVTLRPSDFSDDDRKRMRIFGTPRITVHYADPVTGARMVMPVDITELYRYPSTFSTPAEAADYEKQALSQIREKMDELRAQVDDYSSSDEVEL